MSNIKEIVQEKYGETARRVAAGDKSWSGRQGCESGGVRVPVPSIACFGRLAYPGHAEVTKHDVPGRRSHRLPRRKLRQVGATRVASKSRGLNIKK